MQRTTPTCPRRIVEGIVQSLIRGHRVMHQRLDLRLLRHIRTDEEGLTACRIASTVSSPSATRRAAITTHAPAWANMRAVALPMPALPPVTNATLPSNGLGMQGTLSSCDILPIGAL
jgi:hypothetical protein